MERLRDAGAVVARLEAAGVVRGSQVGVVLSPGSGAGFAVDDVQLCLVDRDPVAAVRLVEETLRPRWTWWTKDTASVLIAGGLRVATCWDVAAVHRLVFGGFRAEPARAWAALHDLGLDSIPVMGQLDLGGAADDGGDAEDPARPDGHLRPELVAGGWASDPAGMARWAAAALRASMLQQARIEANGSARILMATARSESAAELLCAELEVDGLPIDRAEVERIVAASVGPRSTSTSDEAAARAKRDGEVLRHIPGSSGTDLRNPADVKALLRRAGIDLPDTRAWRLEEVRAQHPLVDALLIWRKAERIATTYGYGWIDGTVGVDGRLRGGWTGSDGAAGRMTAQAGLHNLPADMRTAVAAEPGFVFVRADLGQIEPRVLAAVSGDPALAAATLDDDLYAPVAKRLGVERPVAKVAVLAAMYGQTSGTAGQALRGLQQAYPVAMRYLSDADDSGRDGRDVHTYGGRLVRMWETPFGKDEREERSIVNGRGRFARNAVVQGAAAELFKVWAVTARARLTPIGARIVLCLHDELLVHAPVERGAEAARIVEDSLQEAAYRWAPDDSVRFVADVSVIAKWSEAK